MELGPNDLVLVTGATGLVGSHVAERFVDRRVRTRALVRDGGETALLKSWGVEIVAGDLADADSLRQAIEGVTVVVHCAAKVGDWGPIDDYRRVNVEGLRSLIDAVQAQANLKRFVHISSLGVYEARDHHGTDETSPISLTGIDGYTLSKAEAETLVVNRICESHLPAVVLRPGFIYGPRDRTVLPRIVGKLRDGSFRYLGSGTQLLNNTYVGNLVDAVMLAIERDDCVGEVFNITDGKLLTKREFIGGIARRVGLPEPARSVPLPVARLLAGLLESVGRWIGAKQAPTPSRATIKFLGLNLDYSIEKARNRLGYQPRYSADEGLDAALNSMQATNGTT